MEAKKWKPRIVNAKEVNPRGRLMAAEDQKWNTQRRNRDKSLERKFRVTKLIVLVIQKKN